MLLLGQYGVSESRAMAMTEPEIRQWVDALAALNRPAQKRGHADTHTQHIVSLRRKPAGRSTR